MDMSLYDSVDDLLGSLLCRGTTASHPESLAPAVVATGANI